LVAKDENEMVVEGTAHGRHVVGGCVPDRKAHELGSDLGRERVDVHGAPFVLSVQIVGATKFPGRALVSLSSRTMGRPFTTVAWMPWLMALKRPTPPGRS